jgi:hypothetical protein
MDRIGGKITFGQQSSRLSPVTLAVPLVLGIAIAALGARFGGGNPKRWVALGAGVAVIGDVALLARRSCLSRSLKSKDSSRLDQPIKYIDSDELERVRRNGGRKTILAVDVGRSTVSSRSHELYLEDTERLSKKLGGDVCPAYAAAKHDPIVDGVEKFVKDKTFLEINIRVQNLNGARLALLRRLAEMVRKPEDWDREDVQRVFGELHRKSCELAETIIRFVELKFPDDLEAQAAFLAGAHNGYIRPLIDLRRIYEFAVNRFYFDASEIEETVSYDSSDSLTAADYWNDNGLWKGSLAEVVEDKFFGHQTPEYGWRAMYNRACARIEPVAKACKDDRLAAAVTPHAGLGVWVAINE